MLVHVGNCIVICCHFGAFSDWHGLANFVVILVQFGHCVVIVLSLWCHLGALDDCHCVVILLKMLVHFGHVVVILLSFSLSFWCIG